MRPLSNRRRGSLLAVGLVLAFSVFLAGCAQRSTLPGWRLFPRSEGGLIAQNELVWASGHTWGRADVHQALLAATAHLQDQYPGSKVGILHVSLRKGGLFPPHLSHRAGNDVDVVYLGRWVGTGAWFPQRPHPFLLGYSIKYGAKGRHGLLELDLARNWCFLMGLRRQRSARVQKIFVEPFLEELLLAEGRRLGATSAELAWASSTLRYAGDNALDHKDHMHIRFE